MSDELATTYKRSRMPLYLQVAAVLRRRIEEGHWRPGQKISTLEELEEEFHVARVTVRQAVDLLQKEGLVDRQQGRGTFVTDKKINRRWLHLATSWSSLVSTIRSNVPHFIDPAGAPNRPRLASGEGKPAESYEFLRSLQYQGKTPYAIANVYVAKQVYDRTPERFQKETALSVVSTLDDVSIARARQTLVLDSADPETARLLEIPLNAPIAIAHCVVIDDEDMAVYVGDIVYRGDCVKLDIDLL
jgi:GntR family transcriptional regulator